MPSPSYSDIEDAHTQFIPELFKQVDNRHPQGRITIETGSSTIKSVGLVNKALAMKIRCNCPPVNSFGYFRQFPDWSGPIKKSV
jgi:hypothetical protein